ncbi:MAG: hypothetical protein AMXMBFR64_00720 [Myxococcales bacterium]
MAWLRHPALLWASRLLLGAVFLYAAWYKITDLPGFAANINNYGMVPIGLLPLFATVLAGVEVVTGLALVTGVWRKGAALVVSAMLLMFIVAIGVAYARGKSIDCGCFTAEMSAEKAGEVRAHMLRRIVEDVGMLALGLNLFVQDLTSPRVPEPSLV